ncbi:hypothetical protein [Rhodopirellula halodulae]|uniref:hypothetical protein n=1 Tax=Rhodopirellula halodulae TaxID=2894198 RepID=UPI001E2EC32A|nr:hypothetical protein [Rhodopirellula sp. JC737]MCC9656839.1 hypothetical protein [Rhodopirellula sp. JC737]
MNQTVSTPPVHQLQSSDGSLQIQFQWKQDRYEHRIQLRSQNGESIELHSVEGDSDEDWPASPALQQLSTEDIEGVATILGVGCAGSSHFSISVQIIETSEAPPRLRLDWAVRMTAADARQFPVANLGTEYRFEGAASDLKESFEATGQTQCVVADDSPNVRLIPDQSSGGRTRQWSYDCLGG